MDKIKTMLEILDEVSRESGYMSWYDVYNSGNVSHCNIIPQAAGKRYADQFKPTWVPVDPDVNSEMAYRVETTDSKLIQCLFDDGNICSYNDEWPSAVCTHMYFLPSTPKKGGTNEIC